MNLAISANNLLLQCRKGIRSMGIHTLTDLHPFGSKAANYITLDFNETGCVISDLDIEDRCDISNIHTKQNICNHHTL